MEQIIELQGPQLCYICQDGRRVANIDAAKTTITIDPNSETLRDIFLRALTRGKDDSGYGQSPTTQFNPDVCIVSLSKSATNDEIVDLRMKAIGDAIVLCKRCQVLLKDYDYHEKNCVKIADSIRSYLGKHDSKADSKEKDDCSLRDVLSEDKNNEIFQKQSVKEAYKSLQGFLHFGNPKRDRKGRGRKSLRKDIQELEENEDSLSDTNCDEPLTSTDDSHSSAARLSARIKKRREEGKVIKWAETHHRHDEHHDNDFDETDKSMVSESDDTEIHFQKKRGRKKKIRIVYDPNKPKHITRLTENGPDQVIHKYSCPFCHKYYTPSSGRVHSCLSYKNSLRCNQCNIFFTNHIRLEKHMDVIHLKPKLLFCPYEECQFSCIARPALIWHKHLHFIEESGIILPEKPLKDRNLSRFKATSTAEVTRGEVTLLADDQGVVTSPDVADQVSFLLDEKSFLSDGKPLQITKGNSKSIESFNGKDSLLSNETEVSEHDMYIKCNIEEDILNPIKPTTINTIQPSISKMSPVKGNRCRICDMYFDSAISLHHHILDIHEINVPHKKGQVIKSTKKTFNTGQIVYQKSLFESSLLNKPMIFSLPSKPEPSNSETISCLDTDVINASPGEVLTNQALIESGLKKNFK